MANPAPVENRAETVDIKEYVAVLLKRKWLILICFLLSMAGTTAFLFTRQPIYRANLKLLVSQAGSVIPSAEAVQEGRGWFGTQIDIMTSQTMLRRVQQRMRKTPEEIRENLSNLAIKPLGGTDILVITVDSPSREFAKDFANALSEEYLRFREEDRARSSESAVLTLTREINRLSQEVKAAQDRFVGYAKEYNLPILKETSTTWRQLYSMNLGTYVQIKHDLALAKAKEAALEKSNTGEFIALMGQAPPVPLVAPKSTLPMESAVTNTAPPGEVKAPAALGVDAPPNEPSPAVPASGEKQPPTMSSSIPAALFQNLIELERQRMKLEGRLAELSAIYKPRHPAVATVQTELNEVLKSIQFQVRIARDMQRAEVISLEGQLQAANTALQEAEGSINDKSLRLLNGTALSDDLERVRAQYNAMLGQLMKLDVASGFRTRIISILEPALVEGEPIYPKKMKGLMVAAFFGLGLGLALAFFIEYIDDSIKMAEEVERDLQLPFLGMIPAAQWNPDDLTAHRLDRLKQQGGVAESYRVVRSAILFAIPSEKLRTILMTSAVPREGKTTTCVNLSIGFAQTEQRVLLIDADLRRGEIHKYFGFERDKGLTDILMGEMTPEEAVRHTNVPKLDVITTGPYPANPAELLLGWRLKELLDWAKKHYDRVIIDSPPIMGIADGAILGSLCDGALFVIWAGRTSRRYVRVAKATAVSRGARLFGFVLNNLEPGRVGYYHYYPYYYSYYSRGYYYAHKDEDEGKGGDFKDVDMPSPDKKGKDEIQDVY